MKKSLSWILSAALLLSLAIGCFVFSASADSAMNENMATEVYITTATNTTGKNTAPEAATYADAVLKSGDSKAYGSGTASFKDGVLTLENVSGVAKVEAFDGSLIVNVKGTNTLENGAGRNVFVDDRGTETAPGNKNADVTITSDSNGVLNLKSTSYNVISRYGNVVVDGNVTINVTATGAAAFQVTSQTGYTGNFIKFAGDCKVDATAKNNTVDVKTKSSSLIVADNAQLTAKGTNGPVLYTTDKITITDNAVVSLSCSTKEAISGPSFAFSGKSLEVVGFATATDAVVFTLGDGLEILSGADAASAAKVDAVVNTAKYTKISVKATGSTDSSSDSGSTDSGSGSTDTNSDASASETDASSGTGTETPTTDKQMATELYVTVDKNAATKNKAEEAALYADAILKSGESKQYGSGTISFKDGVATLENVTGVAKIEAFDGSLIVDVKGTNVFENTAGRSVFVDDQFGGKKDADLTITSSSGGKLTVSSSSYAVFSRCGNITVSGNVTLEVTTTGVSAIQLGNVVQDGTLTFKDDAKVIAKSTNRTVDINRTNGTIVVQDNANVDATASSGADGAVSVNGTGTAAFTVSDKAVLKATAPKGAALFTKSSAAKATVNGGSVELSGKIAASAGVQFTVGDGMTAFAGDDAASAHAVTAPTAGAKYLKITVASGSNPGTSDLILASFAAVAVLALLASAALILHRRKVN